MSIQYGTQHTLAQCTFKQFNRIKLAQFELLHCHLVDCRKFPVN